MIAKHKYLVLFIIACVTTIIVLSVWYSNKITRFEGEITDQIERSDSLTTENLFLVQLSGIDNNFIEGNYEEAKVEYQRLLRDLDTTHPLYNSVIKRLDRIQSIEGFNNSEASNQDIEVLKLSLMKRDEVIELLNAALDSTLVDHTNERESLMNQLQSKNSELKDKVAQLNRKEKIQVISFKSSKGKTIHYLGEVKDGKANGGGVGIWSTGSIYKGEWKDNKRHGKGRYEWADGDIYEGNYVEDTREGEGVYSWLSGERYSGEWAGDKRNGYGKLFDKDNNLKFEGEWQNDRIVE